MGAIKAKTRIPLKEPFNCKENISHHNIIDRTILLEVPFIFIIHLERKKKANRIKSYSDLIRVDIDIYSVFKLENAVYLIKGLYQNYHDSLQNKVNTLEKAI